LVHLRKVTPRHGATPYAKLEWEKLILDMIDVARGLRLKPGPTGPTSSTTGTALRATIPWASRSGAGRRDSRRVRAERWRDRSGRHSRVQVSGKQLPPPQITRSTAAATARKNPTDFQNPDSGLPARMESTAPEATDTRQSSQSGSFGTV